jgi:hypothetical protein
MQSRVTGWWVFAAILLGVSGILNVIWGIAAIGNSHFFTANAHYIFSNLNTWGWITLIIGVLEIIAGFSDAGWRLRQGDRDHRGSTRFDRCTAVHPSRTVLVDLRVRALDHHHLRAGQDAGG